MTTPSYSDARNNQSSDIFLAESVQERLLSLIAVLATGTNPDGTAAALTPVGGAASATAANQATEITALGTLATDVLATTAAVIANTAAIVALGSGALATDAHLTALTAAVVAQGAGALATITSQPLDQTLSNLLAINSLGTILDNGVPRANHTMTYIANGANTAGVITLMGSLDGANFFAMPGASTITTNGTSQVISISNVPFRYVRCKITTGVTGGTGVGVKVASC